MPRPPAPVPPVMPLVPRSSRRRERHAVPTVPAPAPRALPLPHERDESTGQVDPKPSEVIRQAKADLDAGLVDTDMRATPGLDAERREALVPTPTPTRRRRP